MKNTVLFLLINFLLISCNLNSDNTLLETQNITNPDGDSNTRKFKVRVVGVPEYYQTRDDRSPYFNRIKYYATSTYPESVKDSQLGYTSTWYNGDCGYTLGSNGKYSLTYTQDL